ncbi:MAG: hypothetical protein ABI895_08840 [Deltaproteobacteria bacterium]
MMGSARAHRWLSPRSPRNGSQLDAESPSYALGVSLGFLQQRGLGTNTEASFVPSLVGFAYVPAAPRLFLRPGLRLGYEGLSQASASYGAQVRERGVQGTAELGVVFDAWLVPSLTVGAGVDYRSVGFVGRGIVADSDALDRTEWLGLAYAQVGLGLPLFQGAFMIEPYARLQHTFSDDRALLQLGFDLTFAL